MYVTVGTTKKDERKGEEGVTQKKDISPSVVVVTTAMVFSAGFLCGKYHTLSTMKAESEILRNVSQIVR